MGGSFERRTPAEMAVIPMRHDVTAAAVAAACSSTAVAPFLMCVDRAVVAAAAGTAPGGSLFRAIAGVAGEFVTKPKTAFAQPALWMVAGVYGGTYLAKNVSDVCIERRGLSETHKGANAAKFAATTACNMGGSILKDAAFAKLYGAAVAAVVLVPPASYALFAARDCLTIGGAFVVPDALAAGLTRATGASRETAATVSQLVSPPLMQVLCTPMHLLSLSLINDPNATAAARIAKLKLATPAALLARSLRMLPAYGVGGILNSTLVARGRARARCPRWGGGRRRRRADAGPRKEARDAGEGRATVTKRRRAGDARGRSVLRGGLLFGQPGRRVGGVRGRRGPARSGGVRRRGGVRDAPAGRARARHVRPAAQVRVAHAQRRRRRPDVFARGGEENSRRRRAKSRRASGSRRTVPRAAAARRGRAGNRIWDGTKARPSMGTRGAVEVGAGRRRRLRHATMNA